MTTPTRPVVVGSWPVSRLLIILAFIFFVLAALLAGGVITGSGLGWLLPAGLAALTLAWLVP
jgi:hypothetical protein